MEIISRESNARKTLTKQKGLYTKGLIVELFSRLSIFIDFLINTIFFIYIPATSWDFSYFIL